MSFWLDFWRFSRGVKKIRVEVTRDFIGRIVKRVPDSTSPRLRQWLPVVPYRFETPEEYKKWMEREDREINVVVLPTPVPEKDYPHERRTP